MGANVRLARRWQQIITGSLLLFAAACVAAAHPLSQGALDVEVFPDRVDVRVRVSSEEVSVTHMLVGPASPGPAAGQSAAAVAAEAAARTSQWHAQYLATHLRISGDGVAWAGTVVRATPPGGGSGGAPVGERRAVYELQYRPPAPNATSAAGAARPPPTTVTLQTIVLTDVDFLPGTTWEATYVVRIGQSGLPAVEGLLLAVDRPVTFTPDWTPDAARGKSASAGVDSNRLVREYFRHGVHHILTGYDHLLFVTALVLGASTAWDLVKVVTAFTLAHTVTLALAALKLVHLPEGLVEPLIAGSIVVVAGQNVFWPGSSHGRGRLAMAFAFGLFHGLGFAGGLLDAMQEMQGPTVFLAIGAFSVGVEVGHQMIVLPLFAALFLARRTRARGPARERLSLLMLRFVSAAVSAAGLFYLVVAVRASLSSSG